MEGGCRVHEIVPQAKAPAEAVKLAPRKAAKRRKNTAHGASRGKK